MYMTKETKIFIEYRQISNKKILFFYTNNIDHCFYMLLENWLAFITRTGNRYLWFELSKYSSVTKSIQVLKLPCRKFFIITNEQF